MFGGWVGGTNKSVFLCTRSWSGRSCSLLTLLKKHYEYIKNHFKNIFKTVKPMSKGYENERIASKFKAAIAIDTSSYSMLLWIFSLVIFGFNYIHRILNMCYKNTLVHGLGMGKAKT